MPDRNFFKHLLCCLIIITSFICCEPPLSTYRRVNDDLVAGSWSVLEFTESGMNKTTDFENYVFEFINSGRVEASKDQIVNNGEYAMLPIILAEDILANLRMDINSFENDTLKELHERWNFQSHSENLIKLIAGDKVLIIESN